jgi:hypothetical protein
MYNNNNNHNSRSNKNGSRSSMPPPFNEDTQGFPSGFPEEEKEDFTEKQSQPLTPQGKENLRLLRRFYITLIVTGVVLGGFLTWGLVTLMNEWEMINPPAEQHLNN